MGGNPKRRNQTKLGPKPIITNSTKKAQWEGTLRGEIKTKLRPKPIITNSTKKAKWEGTLRGEIKLN
jgi:hypothetical protein